MFVPERKHEQECLSGFLTGHTEQMYQRLSSKTLAILVEGQAECEAVLPEGYYAED